VVDRTLVRVSLARTLGGGVSRIRGGRRGGVWVESGRGGDQARIALANHGGVSSAGGVEERGALER